MASALSTNEVTVLYNDVLFRAADSGGLSFWATALDNGTPTLAQLTNIFVISSEAQTFVDPVIRLYQAVFNRAPDAGGLAYWVGQEHAGVSFSTVVESFVGSAEFVSDYGASPNPTALINSLYLNVLGRAADSGGLSYWLGVLGTPTLASETTVMLGFVNSAEFIADTQSNIDTWLTSAANSALAGTTGSGLGTPTYPATLAVPDTLTVAQANTIYTTDGDTAAVYAVSDTAANLAAAGVDAAVTHATSITATTAATVTQANTIYTTDADTTAIYAVSDTAANIITDLAGGALAATAPLAHAISVTATGATVTQATTLVAAAFGTGTASYDLADTLANLTAATAIVAGAASYSLTNTAGLLAGITVAQAALVAGATDHASYTYSLSDTAAHLAAGGSAVTDATTSITATGVTTVAQATAILALDTSHVAFTYTLADTLADLTAAGAGIVSGAAAYSLTDASGLLVSITVAEAILVASAADHGSYTYSLSDTATDLAAGGSIVTDATTGITASGVTTVAQATAILALDTSHVSFTYSLSDTLADLAGAATGVVSGATSYSLTDTAGLLANVTVAEATLIGGAIDHASYTYSLADSLADLAAAPDIIAGATSYSLTDTAGLLTGITVAEAILLAGATDHASYTYSLSDTAAHLAAGGSIVTDATTSIAGTGVTTVAQATAILALDTSHVSFTYSLSDTLTDLAGAGTGVVSGATSYSLTDAADTAFANITAAEATLAVGATDFLSNAYTFTIRDTAAAVAADSSSVLNQATAIHVTATIGGDISGLTITTTSPTDLVLSGDGTETLSTAEYNLFDATGITFTGSAGASNDTIVFSDAGTVTANSNVYNYTLAESDTINLDNAADNVTGTAGDDIVNFGSLTAIGTVALASTAIVQVDGADISGLSFTDDGTAALQITSTGTNVETMTVAEYNDFGNGITSAASAAQNTIVFSDAGTVTANSNVYNYTLAESDTINLDNAADSVTGTAGDDVVNFGSLTAIGTVALASTAIVQVDGADISGLSFTDDGTAALQITSTGTNVETMTVAEYNDFGNGITSAASAAQNTIVFSDAGTVTANSNVYNYTLAESDTINLDNAADSVTGTAGDDVVNFGSLTAIGTVTLASTAIVQVDGADISGLNFTDDGTAALQITSTGTNVETMTVAEYNDFGNGITSAASAAQNTIVLTTPGTVTANSNVYNYTLAESDTINLDNAADSVTGTAGDDVVNFGSLTAIGTVTLASTAIVQVDGADISGLSFTDDGTAALQITSTGTNVETMTVAEYNDFGNGITSAASAAQNTIVFSDAGTVTANSNVYNYTLAESDTINLDNAADSVTGTAGDDVVNFGSLTAIGTVTLASTAIVQVDGADISGLNFTDDGTAALQITSTGTNVETMTVAEYNDFGNGITSAASAAQNTIVFSDAGTVTANSNVYNYTLAATGDTISFAQAAPSQANADLIYNYSGTADTLKLGTTALVATSDGGTADTYTNGADQHSASTGYVATFLADVAADTQGGIAHAAAYYDGTNTWVASSNGAGALTNVVELVGVDMTSVSTLSGAGVVRIA